MYRITRTIFQYKNGEKKYSDEIVYTNSLDEYREKIKKEEHENINFIYQKL